VATDKITVFIVVIFSNEVSQSVRGFLLLSRYYRVNDLLTLISHEIKWVILGNPNTEKDDTTFKSSPHGPWRRLDRSLFRT
jgi:hypothetical protein